MAEMTCWRCGHCADEKDMFFGPECDRCAYIRISMARSQKFGGPVPARCIQGLSMQRSRYVLSQVKKHRCAQCGERLCVWGGHIEKNAMLVRLCCTAHDNAHPCYGLITPNGKLVGVYPDGEWSLVGRVFYVDEIPF